MINLCNNYIKVKSLINHLPIKGLNTFNNIHQENI